MSGNADFSALEARSLISAACACVSMSPNPIMAVMIRTTGSSHSFSSNGKIIDDERKQREARDDAGGHLDRPRPLSRMRPM
jgi:hypothetical protein